MSVAEEARAGARAHPFLLEALRAGVLNYSAAARLLELEDEAAGAAALRRLADELPPFERAPVPDRVRVERGVGAVGDPTDALFTVGDTHIGRDAGDLTAVSAEGIAGARALAACVGRLSAAAIDPVAAGWTDDRIVVVVARADVATAIRAVEGDVPGSTH